MGNDAATRAHQVVSHVVILATHAGRGAARADRVRRPLRRRHLQHDVRSAARPRRPRGRHIARVNDRRSAENGNRHCASRHDSAGCSSSSRALRESRQHVPVAIATEQPREGHPSIDARVSDAHASAADRGLRRRDDRCAAVRLIARSRHPADRGHRDGRGPGAATTVFDPRRTTTVHAALTLASPDRYPPHLIA